MVDILMAVYNGGEFLKKQLDSVLAQDYGDIRLIICDDCSDDGSRAALETYKNRFPDRINLVFNDKNIGVKNNFFKLMKMSSAEYVMFCDQDDIWDKDKVSRTLSFMKENEYGGPLLVHTDLRVIDENDKVTAASFNEMQAIDPLDNGLNVLLVQNTVTGCTAMINRALADIVKRPKCKTLHDWWLAVTAAAFGRIAYLPEATMGYRRHSRNLRGARSMKSAKYILGRAADKSDAKTMIKLGYAQSKEFCELYKDDFKDRGMLEAYGACLEKGKIGRIKTVIKYKILKQGLIRRIGQFIYM